MIRRIIAFGLGILAGTIIWLICSCEKNSQDLNCSSQHQQMVSSQFSFEQFCSELGISVSLNDSEISAMVFTPLGNGLWENNTNANIVSSQYHPYDKWVSLRDSYQSNINKYNTCINH